MPKGWKFWPDKEPGPLDHAYVQHRWIRPYRPGPIRVAAALAIGSCAAYLAFTGYLAALSQPSVIGRIVGILLAIAVAGVPAWTAARLLAVGVYVTDFGVRVLGMLRSDELTWPAVADVRRVPGQVRVLGLPWRHSGESVWLVLADGSDRQTPLTNHGPDFLGRPEAYDMAAGAIEGWFEASRRAPKP